ncbi:cytochrome P450 [Flagelloscypha sp. PMI_526]|nr:cytochrome P450 [Flagelloscypha sp. PMI_526]
MVPALPLIALGTCFHIGTLSYELDFYVLPLLAAQAAAFLVFVLYQVLSAHPIVDTLRDALLIELYFHIGLWTSTLLHRLLFHRLNSFPGPWQAKITRLYVMWTSSRKLQQHLETSFLHSKHGDFVRTGPRELSIRSASAIPALYGHQTQCSKGLWYSAAATSTNDPSMSSLNGLRDKAEHKRRRRAWDRALSLSALQTYEHRIVEKTTTLVNQLKSRCTSGALDMTDWCSFFVFDVMGDVGLGKDFGALANGVRHPAMKGIRDVASTVGIAAKVPWLLRILQALPGAAPGYMNFFAHCEKQVIEKKKVTQRGSQPEDILSWLITAEWNGDKSAPSAAALPEDARLLILAGSDTTGTVLTNSLYYLVRNPSYMRKLVASIDALFPNGDSDWAPDQLKLIPMLDDVMYETLRLAPSVPDGLTRLTPPEGLTIDNVYIPGDVIVSVPPWSIQRDSRYWEDAHEFKPERWSEGGLNPETCPAYIPFTRGAHACPGKHLAKLEFRMALSRLLLNFTFSFADEENAANFEEGQMDTFTLTIPPLLMDVRPR